MSTWFSGAAWWAESRDVYFGLNAAVSRRFAHCAWNCSPIASLPKESFSNCRLHVRDAALIELRGIEG